MAGTVTVVDDNEGNLATQAEDNVLVVVSESVLNRK